ncbi:MAG TPA: hypothetical protein DCO77_10760 [Nitrospiraceae bacterium]|nr:hypothetical protein [Nitrospiraceae bacterium]
MLKKIAVIIMWAVIVYTVFDFIMITIFQTIVFARDLLSKDYLPTFAYYWHTSTLIMLPSLCVIMAVIEYRAKLPRIYFKRSRIGEFPALLLNMKTLWRGIVSWLLMGLLPFCVLISLAVVFVRDFLMILIPSFNLFLVSSLLYHLYRNMKKGAVE